MLSILHTDLHTSITNGSLTLVLDLLYTHCKKRSVGFSTQCAVEVYRKISSWPRGQAVYSTGTGMAGIANVRLSPC